MDNFDTYEKCLLVKKGSQTDAEFIKLLQDEIKKAYEEIKKLKFELHEKTKSCNAYKKSVKILKAKRIEDKERLRAWHERIALMAHSDTDIEASPFVRISNDVDLSYLSKYDQTMGDQEFRLVVDESDRQNLRYVQSDEVVIKKGTKNQLPNNVKETSFLNDRSKEGLKRTFENESKHSFINIPDPLFSDINQDNKDSKTKISKSKYNGNIFFGDIDDDLRKFHDKSMLVNSKKSLQFGSDLLPQSDLSATDYLITENKNISYQLTENLNRIPKSSSVKSNSGANLDKWLFSKNISNNSNSRNKCIDVSEKNADFHPPKKPKQLEQPIVLNRRYESKDSFVTNKKIEKKQTSFDKEIGQAPINSEKIKIDNDITSYIKFDDLSDADFFE